MIYRPGMITLEQLRSVCRGDVKFRTELEESEAAAPAPGMGVRHYAPRARLVLVEAALAELGTRLAEMVRGMHGERVGVMLPGDVDVPGGLAECRMVAWGAWSRPDEMARDLYAGLRTLDQERCTVILCPLPAAEGIGAAIRDRLKKAGRKV